MNQQIQDGQSIVIANEVVPEQGEDSYAAQTDASGGLICVADGCGGIGARRYALLDNHTEAYAASRLAVDCVCDRVAEMDGAHFPQSADEARRCAASLVTALHDRLTRFHHEYRGNEASQIVRGLHRTLPTTLCLALMDARDADALDCVFLWAGDSRGYVLTADGLRQCTADHLARKNDAMDNLYRESRLSNMVNGDGDFRIDSYGMRIRKPCIVLTATDGAFGYLPTPMEFELLLLSTMQAASDLNGWRVRLRNLLGKLASDDCTLVLSCFGFTDYAQLKAHFAERRAAMQRDFVTPVRRRRQSVDYARGLWEDYRRHYELSEEELHADWRL